MGILTQELSHLYQNYNENITPNLPELPIQYVDFAQWQRQHLQGELLSSQLNYWRENLKDAPHILSLPIDKTRPKRQKN